MQSFRLVEREKVCSQGGVNKVGCEGEVGYRVAGVGIFCRRHGESVARGIPDEEQVRKMMESDKLSYSKR